MNAQYLKTLMVEAGILTAPSPGTTWSDPEEMAWREACYLVGLRYTPYPDRVGQDPDLLDKIDREMLVLPPKTPTQSVVLDVKHLLPNPVKLDPETPAPVARLFKTATSVPDSFTRPMIFEDPLAGLEPNIPRVKKRPARGSAERARRTNALREEETPASETPTTIRVR